MKLDTRTEQLKARAEQIVDFAPHEISNITPEEIQRLFYDLQVYQIELQMQNDELQKNQLDLSQANNRLNFIYHRVPVGILTLDHQGFIEQVNHYFANMLATSTHKLYKKHFSRIIFEEDKNIFIQRFDAFFKSPDNKNLQLRLHSEKNTTHHVLIKGSADDGSDALTGSADLTKRKLVITVTDVSDVIKSLGQ